MQVALKSQKMPTYTNISGHQTATRTHTTSGKHPTTREMFLALLGKHQNSDLSHFNSSAFFVGEHTTERELKFWLMQFAKGCMKKLRQGLRGTKMKAAYIQMKWNRIVAIPGIGHKSAILSEMRWSPVSIDFSPPNLGSHFTPDLSNRLFLLFRFWFLSLSFFLLLLSVFPVSFSVFLSLFLSLLFSSLSIPCFLLKHLDFFPVCSFPFISHCRSPSLSLSLSLSLVLSSTLSRILFCFILNLAASFESFIDLHSPCTSHHISSPFEQSVSLSLSLSLSVSLYPINTFKKFFNLLPMPSPFHANHLSLISLSLSLAFFFHLQSSCTFSLTFIPLHFPSLLLTTRNYHVSRETVSWTLVTSGQSKGPWPPLNLLDNLLPISFSYFITMATPRQVASVSAQAMRTIS